MGFNSAFKGLNRGCPFYPVPQHGICHALSCRVRAFCTINLQCSGIF